MDDHQVQAIVEKTVKHTLQSLGFDLSDPTEVQQDVLFLRRFRRICGNAGNTSVMIVVTAVVLAIIGGVWLAIRSALKM